MCIDVYIYTTHMICIPVYISTLFIKISCSIEIHIREIKFQYRHFRLFDSDIQPNVKLVSKTFTIHVSIVCMCYQNKFYYLNWRWSSFHHLHANIKPSNTNNLLHTRRQKQDIYRRRTIQLTQKLFSLFCSSMYRTITYLTTDWNTKCLFITYAC